MQKNVVQSLSGWMGMCLCLFAGAAAIASAQPVKDETAEVALLRAEVQRLAVELLEYRAELVQWKMHIINTELLQVQAERQRLTGERQLIEREIGGLVPAATSNAGTDDEGRREDLHSVQLPALLSGERAAILREETLNAALSAENARLTEIQKQLQRWKGQTASKR